MEKYLITAYEISNQEFFTLPFFATSTDEALTIALQFFCDNLHCHADNIELTLHTIKP